MSEALVAGLELGRSPWLEVDQARIDRFAAATDDPQWIHVDPVRAAAGPFRTTIAHGFLTLSLLVRFWYEVCDARSYSLTVNYGVNRVRFPAPVPAGSRLRGSFRVLDVAEIEAGVRATVAGTVERDGAEKTGLRRRARCSASSREPCGARHRRARWDRRGGRAAARGRRIRGSRGGR